jgi:hypothetical protein
MAKAEILNPTERLLVVQKELKAPKNQRNNFGKYNYRSCEDILEAVKPLLVKYGLTMIITDKVEEVAGIPLVCATVEIYDALNKTLIASTSAQAGIDPNRKGMDIAQSFGSSSSYARKYALNGMFLIDDTKDADATNTHGKTVTKKKLTTDIKKKMAEAIAKGQKQAVIDRLVDYEVTEDEMKSLLNPQL